MKKLSKIVHFNRRMMTAAKNRPMKRGPASPNDLLFFNFLLEKFESEMKHFVFCVGLTFVGFMGSILNMYPQSGTIRR